MSYADQIDAIKRLDRQVVLLREENVQLQEKRNAVTKLRQEIEQLRAALSWCTESVWDGLDIDGGSFQDHMQLLGLLVVVPASDEFKAEYDTDTMYAWKWNHE